MKINKAYTYPFLILSTISFLGFSLIFLVNKIGLQVNPPQPTFKMEADIEAYVVWEDDGVWKAFSSGKFSMFESAPPKEKSGLLGGVLKASNPEVIFLLIKEDIGKEKALRLLASLTKFKLKKIYVASPFDNTLSNLKRIEPRFWYAPSPKAWVKWSLFSSLYLETIYNLKADFLFVDQRVEQILSSRLKIEIKRRNLPSIKTSAENKAIEY